MASPRAETNSSSKSRTDQVVWGGLSGATPAEAVELGKGEPRNATPGGGRLLRTRRSHSRCSVSTLLGLSVDDVPGRNCITDEAIYWRISSARPGSP